MLKARSFGSGQSVGMLLQMDWSCFLIKWFHFTRKHLSFSILSMKHHSEFAARFMIRLWMASLVIQHSVYCTNTGKINSKINEKGNSPHNSPAAAVVTVQIFRLHFGSKMSITRVLESTRRAGRFWMDRKRKLHPLSKKLIPISTKPKILLTAPMPLPS